MIPSPVERRVDSGITDLGSSNCEKSSGDSLDEW